MPVFDTYRSFFRAVLVAALFLTVGFPNATQAGFLSFFGLSDTARADIVDQTPTSQTIELPRPIVNPAIIDNPSAQHTFTSAVEGSLLAAHIGPLGNEEQVEEYQIGTITTYTVKKGDTLPIIADMFGVSVNTIRWANDLKRGASVKEGDVLTVLPVSGITHIVRKGDSVKSIAKKYGGDVDEIAIYNGLSSDSILSLGAELIIPDGEFGTSENASQESTKKTATSSKTKTVIKSTLEKLPLYAYGRTRLVEGQDGPDAGTGYYIRPVRGGKRTQGLHGLNGVDIAAPLNTPVLAAASGTVITAKNSGWNTGYANYVVIRHANGTQTLYAHLNQATVEAGQQVSQGEQIGLLGSTGRSTGPHLHFEVRGAKNPLGDNPNYGL